MKLVVQRVKEAELFVEGRLIAGIGPGLCVYIGIGKGDRREQADYLAKKTAALRIFEHNGKMDLSVLDKEYEILAISQFTLYADTAHGNRPSFSSAEKPDAAKELYEYYIMKLKDYGVKLQAGVFGGNMEIHQINDGPVTVLMEN